MNKKISVLLACILAHNSTTQTTPKKAECPFKNGVKTTQADALQCTNNELLLLIDFFEQHNNTKQRSPYNASALRQCCSAVGKQTEVNALIFNQLLEQLTPYLKNNLTTKSADIDLQLLNNNLLTLLHEAVSKLVWSPTERHKAWPTVAAISKHLNALADAELIVDQTALNNLFTMLIARYCILMNVDPANLPYECKRAMQKDMHRPSLTVPTRMPWPEFKNLHCNYVLTPLQLFRIHPTHGPLF